MIPEIYPIQVGNNNCQPAKKSIFTTAKRLLLKAKSSKNNDWMVTIRTISNIQMKKFLVTIIITFVSFSNGFAQKTTERGGLIFTLGVDTTMLGNFLLRGQDFELDILVRASMTVYSQKGSFFSNGELKSVTGSTSGGKLQKNIQLKGKTKIR